MPSKTYPGSVTSNGSPVRDASMLFDPKIFKLELYSKNDEMEVIYYSSNKANLSDIIADFEAAKQLDGIDGARILVNKGQKLDSYQALGSWHKRTEGVK